MMLETLIAVVVLLVFDLLILRFGADSRDGNDWANIARCVGFRCPEA